MTLKQLKIMSHYDFVNEYSLKRKVKLISNISMKFENIVQLLHTIINMVVLHIKLILLL